VRKKVHNEGCQELELGNRPNGAILCLFIGKTKGLVSEKVERFVGEDGLNFFKILKGLKLLYPYECLQG
jgi:hypothetical protein